MKQTDLVFTTPLKYLDGLLATPQTYLLHLTLIILQLFDLQDTFFKYLKWPCNLRHLLYK